MRHREYSGPFRHPRRALPYGPSRAVTAIAALALALAIAPSGTAQGSSARGRLQGGGGLRGDYYDDVTPPVLGTPGVRKRKDAQIDFSWTNGAPTGTGITQDDAYSERWTGFVHLDSPGEWTFTLTSDDGARLWIDDLLVVDAWIPHATRDDTATISAHESRWAPIRLEHFNDGGPARIALAFAGPGRTKEIVPSTHLTTAGRLPTPPVSAGPDRLRLPSLASTSLVGALAPSVKVVSSTWSQVGGPTAILTSPASLTTPVLPSGPGRASFRLTIVDSSGWIGTDDAAVLAFDGRGGAEIAGTKKKWHELTFTFTHDQPFNENSSDNPFLNYRLQVYFVHPHSGTIHQVPGYFAADGDAAVTGATSGDKWRANFRPDRSGRWLYLASFRNEKDIAVDLDPHAGAPLSFDGANGTFHVGPADPHAPGFLAQGRLQYVGRHHLQFAETGETFLKGGTDSPENFLGYYEFDNTVDQGGISNALETAGYGDGLHHFDAHLSDYVDLGVGLWNGKGRRIFGAINYLASRGVNSLYALTFNTSGGDGQEVYPWVVPIAKLRYDVSKLDQWARTFEHMQRAGVAINLITAETENDNTFDGGSGFGRERKSYYRELVARFGHALALTWNLGEENSNSTVERIAFYDHLRELDPYDHPITIHQNQIQLPNTLSPLLGTRLEGVSIQSPMVPQPSALVATLVDLSAASGRPWNVCFDEQNPANAGVVPDAYDFWHDVPRKSALWPTIFAQGGGAEWYFGYGYPHSDLDCEDFRSRENMWDLTYYAIRFARNLGLDEMVHADELTTTPSVKVLAKRGEAYALYLPNGGSADLDLEGGTETYRVRWFDPRKKGGLKPGAITQVTGPGLVSLGSPPAGGDDWVAYVALQANASPAVGSMAIEPDPFVGNEAFSIQIRASDPNGTHDIRRATVEFTSPTGQTFGPFRARSVGGELFTFYLSHLGPLMEGTWSVKAEVLDRAGAATTRSATFESQAGGGPNPSGG